jgi:uncharacterized PurR-regulated membrane protein YhhQ (DUF165 family)
VTMRPALAAAGLLASVLAANLATSYLGLFPAGFGLLVTAGTYFAGLSLVLRDLLHTHGGVRWVLPVIAAGVALSAVLGDGRVALASALAFGVSELADLAVYVPLRRRGWRRAVTASNAIGAFADTILFLAIAGFPITGATVGGQLLVKAVWVTVLALAVGEVATRAVRRQPIDPARA